MGGRIVKAPEPVKVVEPPAPKPEPVKVVEAPAPKVVAPPAPKPAATLTRDYSPKDAENLSVELVTEPQQPISGATTQLIFRLKPGDGLEKYLGAWGHMLVASTDLIDLIHEHPFIADGGSQIQFNVTFPRAKAWVRLPAPSLPGAVQAARRFQEVRC